MILTCPECATSYFVDDSRVPAVGRTVKCSNCGAKWVAVPEVAAEPEAPPATSPTPLSRPETPLADDIVVEGPEIPAAQTVAPRPRRSPPTRSANGKVLVLAGTAAVIAVLIAGLLVFRAQMVALWPASGAAYARVGLRVNDLGLVIERIRVDPAFQGGRPVLAVTGQIRNVRDSAVIAPGLKVSLLDKAGKPLAAKLAKPIDGRVPGHAVRHFAIAVVDPPAGVHDLEVTFETQPAVPAPRAANRAAADPAAGGPTPVEARPLPSGSPDSLSPQ